MEQKGRSHVKLALAKAEDKEVFMFKHFLKVALALSIIAPASQVAVIAAPMPQPVAAIIPGAHRAEILPKSAPIPIPVPIPVPSPSQGPNVIPSPPAASPPSSPQPMPGQPSPGPAPKGNDPHGHLPDVPKGDDKPSIPKIPELKPTPPVAPEALNR